jgi:CubicO group peptidase (beta-lactamase class C family)
MNVLSQSFLALAASLAVTFAADSQAPTSSSLPLTTAAAPDADRAAVADTRTYLRRLEKLGFAGAVLVARGEVPLFAEGFGLADREHGVRWTPGTISDIGSITKQFTGAAILKLEEAGKLEVGDPITRYFQGVPADKAGITVHQLLTHSSGLSDPDIDDFDPVPLDEYVKQTFARPLLFAPGKGYSYSNANFSLLGAILEKLSGATYESFLRQRLFLPNGMYETGYTLPAWGESRFAPGYEAGEGAGAPSSNGPRPPMGLTGRCAPTAASTRPSTTCSAGRGLCSPAAS